MSVVTGKVAFANLMNTEVFNGQDTGKYSVVLTLDDTEADKLEAAGVKIKTYKNTPQRKFATKFENIKIVDNEGEPVSKSEIRYGATVRVKYELGKPSPQWGATPYLQAIRLLEEAPEFEDDDDDF